MSEQPTPLAPVHAVLQRMESSASSCTDEQWSALLGELVTSFDPLTTEQREQAEEALVATRDRVAMQRTCAHLREVLPAATRTGSQRLDEHWEVVEMLTAEQDTFAIVMPTPARPDEPPVLRRRIDAARAAALSGTCPRCLGILSVVGTELEVVHDPECKAEPHRVTNRRRHPQR